MYRSNHTASSPFRREDGLGIPPVRSCRQVARILSTRLGKTIRPGRVARVCRQAELKIIRALLRDSVARSYQMVLRMRCPGEDNH